MTEREMILQALAAFIAQRPGMDPRNYISSYNDTQGRAAYRAESRSVTKDRHDAEALLRYVAMRESITAEILKEAFSAFSGRLSYDSSRRELLDYCTGGYFPTEYRKAVCAVLAAAIWQWLREDGVYTTGDAIRKAARRELGSKLAARWFN
jgi:hypothetical protein